MTQNFSAALDEISIFQGLTDEERAAIARICRWRRVRPQEHVITHQELSTDVFFVVQGNLRVINYAPVGRQVSFVDVGPGKIFGEFAAIDGRARSSNVIALDDAFIGSMSATEFWKVLENHFDVAAAVLKTLTDIIRQLNERIFEFSTLAVHNRIHAELLKLAFASGVENNCANIDPAPTHAEIASRIGTTRETVTREINALTRSGVLTMENRVLEIQDVAWLQEAIATKLGRFAPQTAC